MGTDTPGEVPPPPPPQEPAAPRTRIAGQETAPVSEVPIGPPSAYAPVAGQTSTMAVISLVAGLASFFGHIVLPGIGGGSVALIAIVTGYIARQQIRVSGERGMAMATIGMILGIVHFAILILLFIAIIVAVFVFGFVWLGFHK